MINQRFSTWQFDLQIYSRTEDVKLQREARLNQYNNLQLSVSEDEMSEIMKDINRTYQELELFQQEENKQLMAHVMGVWCSQNLEYRQGMNEIIGVVYFTYRQEYTQHDQYTECELFFVLKQIFETANHREIYNYSSKTPIEDTPIIKRIQDIKRQLAVVDTQLYQIFEENKISTEIFLMRWIKCLLSREFEIEQTQLIWDVLFKRFSISRLTFLDSLIIAMMISLKPKLLEIEFLNNFEVLFLFQHYPPTDINWLLQLSEKVQCQILRTQQKQKMEYLKVINPSYALSKIFQKLFK